MNNKRKFVLVIIGVLIAAGAVWFVGTDTLFCLTVTYEGEGTESNPYEVSNVEQLQCIESQGLDASYVLVSDIDASETSEWNGGKGFEPIGEFVSPDHSGLYSYSNSFTGTLDGRGHNITDLTINRGDSVGLFSIVGGGGSVTNVSVVDADVTGSRWVGGLAGLNDGRINESYVTGQVEGDEFVGGLVGENYGAASGKIEKSYASVSVDGEEKVGGLVGWNGIGKIKKSYATGAVSGDSLVGGLVGWNNERGRVVNSYATASVNGDRGAGGLVGYNTGGIRSSYATGGVKGSEDVGGLIGRNGGFRATNSYWDMNTTGQSTSAGNGTGLTTTEMTGSAARENMSGFDFTNTWRTVTNPDDYPALAWEKERE